MGVVFLGNPAPLGAIPEGDGRGGGFPKKTGPIRPRGRMSECVSDMGLGK